MTTRIGTAGWTIPRLSTESFAGQGSHLERYAQILNCTEINSTFYRPPQPKTLLRWAATVPAYFRFSLKAPKAITHEAKLDCEPEPLHEFLASASLLGERLGPILVQLPPSLAFNTRLAEGFFTMLRDVYAGLVACEPRHASWFTPAVSRLLSDFEVARVAADPARVPEAGVPGGWPGLVYYRLHGSPRTYYSEYSGEYLDALAATIVSADTWVIFDNTGAGFATRNALALAGIALSG
jgi:uncharacterized protein YecE (DUF72 family)